MTRHWYHIAKAEFYVQTARIRSHRLLYTLMILGLAMLWAIFIAPIAMWETLVAFVPPDSLRGILIVSFPGLMRSVMLLIWLLLLITPITRALEEIKIGHWELFLSNNVKTRDILVGSFLGAIPYYSTVAIFLVPLLISPFLMALEVSAIGAAIIYSLVALNVAVALWISSVVTAVIQSKLGDSPRGNDIAKALSFVMVFLILGPMYGLMYAAPQMSALLGADVFLLLPSTWSADAATWLAIASNGINLTELQVGIIEAMLPLNLPSYLLLTLGFIVVVAVLSLMSADRIFTISAGARTEVVTTVKRENIFLRGIRRVVPGSMSSLIVTNVKDYFRKAQNISKITYGLVLSVLIPVMMISFTDIGETFVFRDVIPMFGGMFVILGALPFAGVGFLESKNQLWILQSAPRGASRYIKARLAMAAITDILMSCLLSLVLSLVLHFSLLEGFILFLITNIILFGSSMVAIGVTARNPNFEDVKSAAHKSNMLISMLLPIFVMVFTFLGMMLLIMSPLGAVMTSIMTEASFEMLVILMGPLMVTVIGALLLWAGINSLTRPAV